MSRRPERATWQEVAVEDSKRPDLLKEFYLECGFATRALHAGEHVGQPQHASHTGAIYQTSTFVFKDAAEGADIFAGQRPGYVYTRLGNPTVMVLEAMDRVRIFTLAVSLGCVDSLIQHPASMTHACVPREKREKAGLTDGLVRISVGLEDASNLIGALDEALATI
jgi:cystathionine beta-lyase/cystathionine gamma-synthase